VTSTREIPFSVGLPGYLERIDGFWLFAANAGDNYDSVSDTRVFAAEYQQRLFESA
jgi:hypothetical protein